MKTGNEITIEALAEKLNGKMWVKGDLKRIYLDRGYNTKKMSTRTYVYQKENGNFGVSCYIDCPSQPHQWIKSQQEEIIESVENDIEEAMATSYFSIQDKNTGLYLSGSDDVFDVLDNCTECNLSKKDAESRLDEISTIRANKTRQLIVVEISRQERDSAIEKQFQIYCEKPSTETKPQEIIQPPKPKKFLENFEIGETLIHATWGNVTVISEDEKMVVIDYKGEQKKLLKRFAPLSREI